MGIALVRRTTRSVSLTEAGQQLYADVSPSIGAISQAAQAASSLSGTVRGQLRLAVSSIAERFLSGPLLASFADAHPEVQLDIVVTDEEFDIVAEQYDAACAPWRAYRTGYDCRSGIGAAATARRLLPWISRPFRPADAAARIDRSQMHRLAGASGCCALSVGICRERTRICGGGAAGLHHQRHAADDQAGMRRIWALPSAWKRRSVPIWKAGSSLRCWKTIRPFLLGFISIIPAAATLRRSCAPSSTTSGYRESGNLPERAPADRFREEEIISSARPARNRRPADRRS